MTGMSVILRAFAGSKSKRFPSVFTLFMKMRPLFACLAGAWFVFGAGCASSLESRIRKSDAPYDSYPAEVRSLIERGDVAVGFTPEQVRLALDVPDRIITRKTEEKDSEVWIYRENGNRFGLGLGVGMGSSSLGAGVGVNTARREFFDERMRVVFSDGRVTAVERVFN